VTSAGTLQRLDGNKHVELTATAGHLDLLRDVKDTAVGRDPVHEVVKHGARSRFVRDRFERRTDRCAGGSVDTEQRPIRL
jgi:hypothetical protein